MKYAIPFVLLSLSASATHLTPDQKIDQLHHGGWHTPVAMDDVCEVNVPCDVLVNDMDLDGNALTIESVSGGIPTSPNVLYTQAGTYTYVVTDGGTNVLATDTGTVTVNGAPPSNIVHEWTDVTPGFNAGHVTWPDNYTATFLVTANSWGPYSRLGSQQDTFGSSDVNHDFMVSASNGQARARVCTDGFTEVMVGGVLLSVVEQRFDVTYDGSFAILFVDGVQVASIPKTGVPCSTPSRDFYIGSQATGLDVFDGEISEVTIRDFAMTPAEILADMGSPPPPPPPEGGAHVVPADEGVTIGPGVIAALPTTAYTGPLVITTANTVIESVTLGCIEIQAPGFVLRNSILTCGGTDPVKLRPAASGALFEYNKIICTTGEKVFRIDAADFTISNNVIHGCEDGLYIAQPIGTSHVVRNVFDNVVGGSGAHADGIQLGSTGQTPGTLHIRENYWALSNSQIGVTGALFMAAGTAGLMAIVEDNWFVEDYGLFILRCGSAGECQIRRNIWESATHRFTLSSTDDGANITALECNRLGNGSFIPQIYFSLSNGVVGPTHITSGC